MSYRQQYPQQRQRRRRPSLFSGLKLRLLIGGAIVLFSVVSFMNKGEINPITGKKQRVDRSISQEIALGIQEAPRMGPPSRNRRADSHVDQIGYRLVKALEQQLYADGIENPYPFEFHLLAKSEINAFALPGGQIFMTEALYRALEPGRDDLIDPDTNQRRTEQGLMDLYNSRLAGVLGHEIGHVIERHGSERMAKGNLIQGIVGAAGIGGGGRGGTQAAAYVGNLINMKYGRTDELESDEWGIGLMVLAGYHPKHLLDVMEVLKASNSGGPPEFLSTHPSSDTRIKRIKEIIGQKQQLIDEMLMDRDRERILAPANSGQDRQNPRFEFN